MSLASTGAPGALLFAGMEGLSLFVGFLMQPLLMRALGPAVYGNYALACAMGVLAYTVTDVGFNLAGVQRAVELAEDPVATHRHFWSVQSVKALSLLACWLAGLSWALAVDTRQAWLIAFGVVLGSASAFAFPWWYLFGRQKMLWVASSLLAARVLCLTVAPWLVLGPLQVAWAIVLTLAAPLLAALLVLADEEVRARLRYPVKPHRGELRAAARSGLSMLWLSGHGVATAAVLQSLLMGCTGSATLGLYAAADRVRGGLQGLFTAFGSAVFPRFVQHRVLGDAQAQALVWPLLGLQLLIATSVGVLLYLWAPQVVQLVLGQAFIESVPVLRVLVLALVTTTAVAGLGAQVMLPRGLGRYYTLATLGVLILQCAAVPPLAAWLGATGAAWALVLSEGVVALLAGLLLVRRRTIR